MSYKYPKIGRCATRIYKDNSWTIVKYHSTEVVAFNSHKIILCNGGWLSPTTIRRMDQTSDQFGLNFYTYRRKGVMYCYYRETDTRHVFVNGKCVLSRPTLCCNNTNLSNIL